MENPYGLRLARPDDFDSLLAFALHFIRIDAVQPVSVEKVERLVARCVAREGAIAGLISGPQGIKASVGVTVEQFDYSDESHLLVRWLGVAEEFRQTDLSVRMVKYVRWLHETAGETALPVFLPITTTSDQGRKVALYERRAPKVGALHAFGCLPDRSFLSAHSGNGGNGATGNRSAPVAAGPIAESA
jgi:hypothetical protein